MGRTVRGFFASLAIIAVGAAQAEIYKWVDKDGNTHYGDRPQDEASEPVSVRPTAPTAPAAGDASGADRREAQQRLLRALDTERQQKEQARAKADKERAENERRCAAAREQLRKTREAGFLYYKNQQGERVVLDDAQRKAATGKAEAEVKKFCR